MYRKLGLTTKEQMYIADAVTMENLFLTKCNVYADQMQDQELKSLLFSLVKSCRDHASQLNALQGKTVVH